MACLGMKGTIGNLELVFKIKKYDEKYISEL